MSDRLSRLESELRSLRDSLARLQRRVDELEGIQGAASTDREPAVAPVEAEATGAAATADRAAPETDDEEFTVRVGARLVGGVLLVIAGGYLLRALTEADVLPRSPGIAAGLAYALAWSVVGFVLGGRGHPRSAAANGVATALLAFPLLWEATVRFGILSPWTAMPLLLLVGAALLQLARRHRLGTVAWVAVLGLSVTCFASMFGTRSFEPYALALLLLGLGAAVWGRRQGGLLPWVAYGAADLGALLLILGSLGDRPVVAPVPALPILTLTFLGFLGIFVHRTWRTGELAFDEPVQGTLATLLGFGGALLVAGADLPAAAPWLAGAGLLVGIAGYLLLLTYVRWSREHRWPFLLYSSLALGTVAMAVVVLFPEPGWVFAGLAVALAGAGVLLDRTSPGLHAAMSLLLGAITGGLVGAIRPVLVGGTDAAALELPPAALATVAAAAVCALLPLKSDGPVWPSWLPRLGRALVILVVTLGLATVSLRALLPALAAAADAGATEAAAAATRTGVLAILIVALALASHARPLQPASWLVYPLLVVAGLELVLVNLPRSNAITMAVALLLYGGALILAPRWHRLRDRP